MRHKESKHEGKRYFCDKCEHSASRLDTLWAHKTSIHREIRPKSEQKKPDRKCDECDYVGSRPEYLREHKLRVHKASIEAIRNNNKGKF